MGNFNIITLNFSRIRNGEKILQVINQFKNHDIDFFCLQEIDVDSALKFLSLNFQVFISWNMQVKS